MASLIVAVVVGFAFNYDPKLDNELNISKNPVLYNRVNLLRDWLAVRDFSQADKGKLKVILSGRGAIRIDKDTKKENETDIAKLQKGLTEATMMKKYIDQDSRLRGQLKDVDMILDHNSRITIENAIFTFWALRKHLSGKTRVPMKENTAPVDGTTSAKGSTIEVNKDGKIVIDLNFFTSDFHLSRSLFLFKLFYEAAKAMKDPVLKDIDIPVLNFAADSVEYFLDKKTFPNRVISTNGITAKHKDESDLETTTFQNLKTSDKDSPKGFFGYLEDESLKTWEVVSKQYNQIIFFEFQALNK